MIPVSGRWASTIAQNHRPVWRVDLHRQGSQIIADLPVVEAQITKDATLAPRTQATLTVSDTSEQLLRLLTPFGYRCRFWRGLEYPDRSTELILVADLDIIDVTYSRPDAEVSLDLADASQLIADDQTPVPGPISSFVTTVQGAIANLIGTALWWWNPQPALIDQTGPPQALTPGFVLDQSRWDQVEQLADSIGAECYFTPDRRPLLRPVPPMKALAAADAQLYTGDGGTVTMTSSGFSRQPNAVYVIVEPADGDDTGQVVGRAIDANPASPTYLLEPPFTSGQTPQPYGRVVSVETRPGPMTLGQANAAAQVLLARQLASVRDCSFQGVPNPALECGDTVAVRWSNGYLEPHVVQSVSIPFGGDDIMAITTRSTAYTTAGIW